jgi:magnesium-transporting ATPase (P-type)
MAVAVPSREERAAVPAPLTAADAAALRADDALARPGSGPPGLPGHEAARRPRAPGPHAVRPHPVPAQPALASQLRSPLPILPAATALASAFPGQASDAAIIGAILLASVGMGFVNEYKAAKTAEALHSSVRHSCVALRDGHPRTVDVTELVPGDVVDLQLGQVVPADLRLLAVAGLECDESVLTGESVPAEKSAEPVAAGTPLAELSASTTCCTTPASWPSPPTRSTPSRSPGPRWDVSFIRRFMLFFGPISSVFDFITFGVMLWGFHAGPALFRSGWFVESLATQTLVIFAIRTRRIPFFRSRPSLPLTLAALAVVTVGTVLPFTPLGHVLGFGPLPGPFFLFLMVAIISYLALIEVGKHWFYRSYQAPAAPAPRHRTPGHRVRPRRPLHRPHSPADRRPTPPAQRATPTRRRECSECFRCLMVCARDGSRSSTSR